MKHSTEQEKEINRIKALPLAEESGATFELSGHVYSGIGIVVPILSINVTQQDLSLDLLNKFIDDNTEALAFNVKVGLYKFPDSDLCSIDLNIIVAPKFLGIALAFGKMAGQKALFNMETMQNEETGANGENTLSFTPQEFHEIATDLSQGGIPMFVYRKFADQNQ